MLAKLLKYEFKATGRVLLPLYAVLLILSLLMSVGVNEQLGKIPWGSWLGIVPGLTIMLYGCVFGAAIVVTVLLLIQRFYKSLLRDEGYLMNTLPVKPWQNIAAKLIPATVWGIIGTGAAVLSVMIIGMDWVEFSLIGTDISELFRELFRRYGAGSALLPLLWLVSVMFALAQSILHIYLAMAIGHMANKARLLWSVVAYIGISMVEGLGAMLFAKFEQGTHLLSDFATYLMNSAVSGNTLIMPYATMGGFILLNFIVGGIMFLLTTYILKNRLNLE